MSKLSGVDPTQLVADCQIQQMGIAIGLTIAEYITVPLIPMQPFLRRIGRFRTFFHFGIRRPLSADSLP